MDKQHVFETAGLGRAPFHYVRLEVRTYQACHGAPVQVGATCDFCGTGIKNCCVIRDADGREFVVGTECVRKAGDAGLRRVVDAEIRRQAAERKHARDTEAAARLPGLIEAHADALAAMPHPNHWRAEQGETRLDYERWCMENAGVSNNARTVRWIEKTFSV